MQKITINNREVLFDRAKPRDSVMSARIGNSYNEAEMDGNTDLINFARENVYRTIVSGISDESRANETEILTIEKMDTYVFSQLGGKNEYQGLELKSILLDEPTYRMIYSCVNGDEILTPWAIDMKVSNTSELILSKDGNRGSIQR